MKFRTGFLALGLCFGLAATATAQTTTEQPADTNTQSEAEIFPVAPANPAADQLTKEKFGDWEKRCDTSNGECIINYLARDAEQNPVAEINIQKLSEGGDAVAGATVISPLGTLLTSGIRLQVDGGRALQYPFAWCTQQGCFSRFGLTQDSIDSLKHGAIATVTIYSVSNRNKPILLNVSLNGFTTAFDSLSAQ